jgi:hypothetical protein
MSHARRIKNQEPLGPSETELPGTLGPQKECRTTLQFWIMQLLHPCFSAALPLPCTPPLLLAWAFKCPIITIETCGGIGFPYLHMSNSVVFTEKLVGQEWRVAVPV